MAETTDNPLERILQLCAATAPAPWYPSAYAKNAAVERDSLDPPLERLRLAGLIRLTDWVKGMGQGYVLTAAGSDVLNNPRALSSLRSGTLRLEIQPPPEPLLDDATTKAFARGDAVRNVFMVETRARVTLALIFANLLVFFYGMQLAKHVGLPIGEYLGTDSLAGGHKNPAKLEAVYVGEGAMRESDLIKGQWWRLLSCCFVHLGLIHIAVNLFSLYMVGPLTERMWGPVRYFVLYMLAGFGGSCSMAAFTSGPWIGAGASGAIWGLMTSVITWLILNREHMPRPFVNTMLRRLFNLVLLNVFISFAPGISMAAHFGGGIAGVLASVLLHGNQHGKILAKTISTLGLLAFPVVCFAGVLYLQKADPNFEEADYQLRFFPKLAEAEKQANAIFTSRLSPIFTRRFQGVSEQDLREAVIAEKDAVQVLERALQVASQAPAYKNALVENNRQRKVQALARDIGDVEQKTWQELIGPAVRDELRLAGRLNREKVQLLFALPAQAREKESQKEAEALLAEQVGKLAGLRELLQLMGPMQSEPGLEETRQEDIADLTLYHDLLKSAAIGLQDGADWPEEQRKEYERLQAKLKERGS